MKVGDIVRPKDLPLASGCGIIVEKKGRSWLKIAWPNGLITEEHQRDMKTL